MTPKAKAKELVDKFYLVHPQKRVGTEQQQKEGTEIKVYTRAKQCALVAVGVILDNDCGYNAYDGVTDNDLWIDADYWQKVKEEINLSL